MHRLCMQVRHVCDFKRSSITLIKLIDFEIIIKPVRSILFSACGGFQACTQSSHVNSTWRWFISQGTELCLCEEFQLHELLSVCDTWNQLRDHYECAYPMQVVTHLKSVHHSTSRNRNRTTITTIRSKQLIGCKTALSLLLGELTSPINTYGHIGKWLLQRHATWIELDCVPHGHRMWIKEYFILIPIAMRVSQWLNADLSILSLLQCSEFLCLISTNNVILLISLMEIH